MKSISYGIFFFMQRKVFSLFPDFSMDSFRFTQFQSLQIGTHTHKHRLYEQNPVLVFFLFQLLFVNNFKLTEDLWKIYEKLQDFSNVNILPHWHSLIIFYLSHLWNHCRPVDPNGFFLQLLQYFHPPPKN